MVGQQMGVNVPSSVSLVVSGAFNTLRSVQVQVLSVVNLVVWVLRLCFLLEATVVVAFHRVLWSCREGPVVYVVAVFA